MSAMKSLVEFLRKPEWIAAIALLIQAVILFLQAVILRRHGATMEEHAGIAKAQAETAKLIGQALDQQGKVLDEQTKIMDEQFKFQRTIELKAAGKLPRPGRSPRIGPGTGRGRRRGHIFLGRLAAILQRFGNRGYRAVQLEVGILGGKMYLAAYAQHLGATGLTFYDDDVVEFFSPHAAGKSAILLVALGKAALRRV